jgi:L-asparaginase
MVPAGLVAAVVAAVVAFAGRADAQALPKVAVLSTGGTIASVYDAAQGGFAPALSGDQLVKAVPGLDTIAQVEVVQVANVPSTNMTPELWMAVRRRADEMLARPDIAGVVVTHGTDTLEETAFFLDLTVASDKPVVVVGAQRAASEFDADGPRNLRDAVLTALAPAARGLGTLVVLNSEIHAAREVTKTNTLNVSTFLTPVFGALGTVDPDGVRMYRAPLRRRRVDVPAGATLGRVEIVTNYAGADGNVVRGLLAQGGLDGLVVEASGVGNLADGLFEALKEVRAMGIPVVISTRVHSGRTLALYAGSGSGVTLEGIGCVFADNLPPHKARVLLLAAMTGTSDPDELRAIFSG